MHVTCDCWRTVNNSEFYYEQRTKPSWVWWCMCDCPSGCTWKTSNNLKMKFTNKVVRSELYVLYSICCQHCSLLTVRVKAIWPSSVVLNVICTVWSTSMSRRLSHLCSISKIGQPSTGCKNRNPSSTTVVPKRSMGRKIREHCQLHTYSYCTARSCFHTRPGRVWRWYTSRGAESTTW